MLVDDNQFNKIMNKKKSKGGRPALDEHLRRKHKIVFYLNDEEYKNLQSLKNRLCNHSPTLSQSDFFRKVVNKFDLTMLEFLDLSPIDEVKIHLQERIAYKSIFK